LKPLHLLAALFCLSLLRALAGEAPPASAGAKGSVVLYVKETAGLRRFGYPASGRVQLPRSAVKDAEHCRLVNDKETAVPAQFTIAGRHQDGSVEWLDVDFSTSPLPWQTQTFFLDYGPDVKPAPARGLTLTETDAAYQVGGYVVPKSGDLALGGIRYGSKVFVEEGRGFTLGVHTKDNRYLTMKDAQISARRIEKAGPVNVTIVTEGKYEQLTDAQPITFVTRLEWVNSKSWVRLSHKVSDPLRRVTELELMAPFALQAPLNFDFGVGSWLYGQLAADERVRFTQTATSGTVETPTRVNWKAVTIKGQNEVPFAASNPNEPRQHAEGWAHVGDAKSVIAVGFDQFNERFGERVMEFYGDGSAFFHYKPTPDLRPRSPNFLGRAQKVEHELAVYFHFVGVPVNKTALTSPPSMLAPLQVTWKAGRK